MIFCSENASGRRLRHHFVDDRMKCDRYTWSIVLTGEDSGA
ncbi:MAG: hypothetical protein ACRAVC_11380 [Trichormus sp.]